MKKLFLFAIMMVALPLMAQDTYPKFIGSDYGYELNGVKYSSVNTTMLRMIIEAEVATAPVLGTLDVIADRWFNSMEGNPYGGYDTIARMHVENRVVMEVDTTRLSSDEYKNVLWSVNWYAEEITPNDTVKTLRFYYEGTSFLSFYGLEADTAYTAYAGRPYNMVSVYNPLMVPLTFSSEKEEVGTVDERGYITVVGEGESMIKASSAGDEKLGIQPLEASWKLVVKEGDHFELAVMALERTEHPWGGGGSYLGFDMVKVTEENCGDILGDGKLSFDIETRTLTMNNFQKIFTEEEDNSMGWMDWLDYYSGPLPLNIHVKGDCRVQHNSAGIVGGWELYITGDPNSSLLMEGRFPQFNAESKITVDGTKVNVIGSTPHPLLGCETLAVMDNSYMDINLDLEVGPGEDPREWGAMCAQVKELELGANTAILTEGVHVENGTFVDADGRTALHVEIGTKKETDVQSIELTEKAQKILHKGQLIIIRDGKTFNAIGARIQ